MASVQCRWRLLHLSLLCGITGDVSDARWSHHERLGDVQLLQIWRDFLFRHALLLAAKVARTISKLNYQYVGIDFRSLLLFSILLIHASIQFSLYKTPTILFAENLISFIAFIPNWIELCCYFSFCFEIDSTWKYLDTNSSDGSKNVCVFRNNICLRKRCKCKSKIKITWTPFLHNPKPFP